MLHVMDDNEVDKYILTNALQEISAGLLQEANRGMRAKTPGEKTRALKHAMRRYSSLAEEALRRIT